MDASELRNPPDGVVADFSQAARTLFAAVSAQDTLASIVALAVETIGGCDYAGVFLLKGNEVVTAVSTDPLVVQVDALQQKTGQGPCLEAIELSVTVIAQDLGTDARWPDFAQLANARGVSSVLALPLYSPKTFGALNLYATSADAFGVIDQGRAQLLAALAALAFNAATDHENELIRSENFTSALTTRELIGQAQGILMERDRITGDEAFDVLRRASQHLNLKLREVAQALIDTGERPDLGS